MSNATLASSVPTQRPRVAVIGGGIAGATCSYLLRHRGADVTVMDMGKASAGGRTSSRATPSGLRFDHGCQFFRPTSPAVERLLPGWLAAGVVAEWRPRLAVYQAASGALRRREELSAAEAEAAGEGFFGSLAPGPLYVGVPSMDSLVAHLLAAEGEQQGAPAQQPQQQQQGQRAGGAESGALGRGTLLLNTRVRRAEFSGNRWKLEGERLQPRGSSGAAPPGGGGGGEGGGGAALSPLGSYDALVLADSQVARPGAPGHIAFAGDAPGLSDLTARLAAQQRVPLFALMLAWPEGAGGPPLPPPLGAGGVDGVALAGGSSFAWMARDTSKPGRARPDGLACWVAVTRPEFAAELLAADPPSGRPGLAPAGPEYAARKAADLWAALQEDLRAAAGGRPLEPPAYMAAHRWGSAYTANPLGVASEWRADGRWAAAGDFCAGPGLGHAASSGAAAADAVAEMLGLGR